MTANDIRIPRRITNELLHLAQLSPTKEVCGLVGSKAGIPNRCYPVDNMAECPEQRFLLDAQQQIQAMTAIRERGEDFFAIFHSHPTSPAIPSETDIKMASYPNVIQMIISLNTKGILELRAFKLDTPQPQEIKLTLFND